MYVDIVISNDFNLNKNNFFLFFLSFLKLIIQHKGKLISNIFNVNIIFSFLFFPSFRSHMGVGGLRCTMAFSICAIVNIVDLNNDLRSLQGILRGDESVRDRVAHWREGLNQWIGLNQWMNFLGNSERHVFSLEVKEGIYSKSWRMGQNPLICIF